MQGNRLSGNRVLRQGQWLSSRNARFDLELQQDGNLVLYHGNLELWSTNTPQASDHRLFIQESGNVILANRFNIFLWQTNTIGRGVYALLQDDANFVVFNSAGTKLWSTETVFS